MTNNDRALQLARELHDHPGASAKGRALAAELIEAIEAGEEAPPETIPTLESMLARADRAAGR